MRAMDEVVSASFNRRSEDVRVLAIIVAELELGDIERKVLFADLVEGADAAALNQRPETFNRVGVDRADYVIAPGVINDDVRIFLVEMLVTDPLVGAEQANLVRNCFVHESGEGRGADVLNHAGDDISLSPDCASNNGLARTDTARAAAASAPVLVAALSLAADECFVNLDNARQFFKVAVSERRTNAVAHIPSGLVRTEAHKPIDLKPAHALLAGQHEVDDAEPIFERLVRVLENCASNVRETVAGLRGTFVALPVPRIALQFGDVLSATAGAFNALRPSLADQIGAASLFVREMSVELGGGKLVNRLTGSHWSSPPVVRRNVP